MKGHPVALSPQWCDILREKTLSEGDFHHLSVLMGLYAHMNDATGLCTPRTNRLAILLGMRKEAVLQNIHSLQEHKWLNFKRVTTANKREKFDYTLHSHAHDPKALIFSAELLTSGLWAYLTPSERKVWLKLRVHSIHGGSIVPDAFSGSDEFHAPSEWIFDLLHEGWHWKDFWFVPEYVLDPEAWATQLGMVESGLALMVDPRPPGTEQWREYIRILKGKLSGVNRQESLLAVTRLVPSVKNTVKSV